MIKGLSPFYVNTSWISGLSGLTSTEYALEVFVWNGAKTNSGSIPTYTITKENATTSTDTDEINIADLVNDFLIVNPLKTTTTEAIDGNNQLWVKTQAIYTTGDPDDVGIPQNISVDLLLKGYGYGMEGENTQAPTNKIHLQGTEFKVFRDSVFSVPVLLDETPSTLDAVNDTIAIFYQTTVLDVLVNDDLGFQPTNIILISTSMPEAVGTLQITGNTIEFTAGTGLVTPQTFDYTIQDSIGTLDTATVTLNLSALPSGLTAVDDFYNVDNSNVLVMTVLTNDSLGTQPTTITAVIQTGITSGTITITDSGTTLTFTPNGIIPTGNETFTYTITDDIAATDQATVTLSVTAANSTYLVNVANIDHANSVTVTGQYATGLFFSFNIPPSSAVSINACVVDGSLNSEPDMIPNFDINITC